MPSTNVLCVEITRLISIPEKMKKKRGYGMQCTSVYVSILCILLQQLQPRDLMPLITRGMPNEMSFCHSAYFR